ncbi:hypothetical protein [Paenibacillus sp. UNC499MF]|uniref:hypothetical protein n=1 Tax=Paenibacillus sp. UNC499MF TaxID=1502751 RepID=UPI0008A005DE|nr:hypothetical protein [Paenibacillus sp. UNC499MF]SEG50939.1 hypothetical protein SAMN02799616_03241 [Paenibacillus sp. UNC499MF]
MLKRTSSLIVATGLLISALSPISVSAQDTKSLLTVTDVQNEQFEKVKLNEMFVKIFYDKAKAKLVKEVNPDSVVVKVVDIATGNTIERYGELIESRQGVQSITDPDSRIVTTFQDRTDGPSTSRLTTQLNVYTKGSYRQINGILSTAWSEASSGSWTLENRVANTISTNTGSVFPTTQINSSGTATVTVKTTSTTTGSFSVGFLKECGFSYAHTSGKDQYYRKPIQLSFFYSLY